MRNKTRSHESIRGNPIDVAVSGPALLRAALDCLIAKDPAFRVVEQANAEVIIEVKVIPVPGDPAFVASFAIVRGRNDPEACEAEFLGLHEPAELLMSSISAVASRPALSVERAYASQPLLW